MTCQDMLPLIQSHPDELDPSSRGLLERHLADCPPCRSRHAGVLEIRRRLTEEAGRLGGPFQGVARPRLPARVRRPVWPWAAGLAAAASLLLWGKVSWVRPLPTTDVSKRPDALPTSVPHPARTGFDGLCTAQAEDREGVVGRSVLVGLRRGGVVAVAGTYLNLTTGALHLDTPGEAVLLKVADAVLKMQDAEVSVEILEKPAALSWLASAEAAEEPTVHMVVWRGNATLFLGQDGLPLGAGQGVLLRREGVVPDGQSPPVAWRGSAGWVPLSAEMVVSKDTVRDLMADPPAEGYVLEALVRKRLAVAELSIRLPAEAGVYEVPVGSYLPGSDHWTRLRLECRGGWYRVSVGSSEIVSSPVSGLDHVGQRVQGGGLGLHAWGGDIEVKQVRWRR